MKFVNKQNSVQFNNKFIADVSKEFNLDPLVAKLIYSRGITTKQGFENFLNPGLGHYFNPFMLGGMQNAVNTIKEHISKGSKILIVGDYDCDGICATAILYKYFESINYKVEYFLPNRFTDGYGLTMDVIIKIKQEINPNLIITVDCGISCSEEIEYAMKNGIDVVVTDHHEPPHQIPCCTCIDAKIKGSTYPFKELCGAGIAFKLVQALGGLSEAIKYDSIAMIATVADIVPLQSENRAIVFNGLKNVQENLPLGIKMLIKDLKIEKLQSSDISFKIAPKINTAGRLGDATLAFKLFIEKDKKEIANILAELNSQNTERISYCNNIVVDCDKYIEKINISEKKALVLYSDSWNNGVLGIVCAKLLDKYNKPVCLLTLVDDIYKGSIRSTPGINIHEVLTRLSPMLLKYGGHSQAGGLTLPKENLHKFITAINNDIGAHYNEEVFEQIKYYDIDLNKTPISDKLISDLARLEPFGFANEKPNFKLSCNNTQVTRMKNHANHIKMEVGGLDVLGFNYAQYFNALNTNSNKELLLDVVQETYKGKQYLKGFIKAIEIGKLNTSVKNELVQANIVRQLKLLNAEVTSKVTKLPVKELHSITINLLKKSSYGTILITSLYETYLQAIKNFGNYISNYECFNLLNQTGQNTLFFSPDINEKINNYTNVIYLDSILCEGAVANVRARNVYVTNDATYNISQFKISAERSVFGIYHNAIAQGENRSISATGAYEYFVKLKKITPEQKNFNYLQFVFVTMVLEELGILNIISEPDLYNITINKEKSSKLENSNIYKFIY